MRSCGDPSLPNIAFHKVDGGGFLFGAIPRLYQVEWSIEGGMTSGSVMFATSGFENGELIPFVTPVRATEGELRVQFLDDEGVVVYDWAADLAPEFRRRHPPRPGRPTPTNDTSRAASTAMDRRS